jgi:hypothetical protein
LNLMKKLKSRFVIEHIDSWIEKTHWNSRNILKPILLK